MSNNKQVHSSNWARNAQLLLENALENIEMIDFSLQGLIGVNKDQGHCIKVLGKKIGKLGKTKLAKKVRELKIDIKTIKQLSNLQGVFLKKKKGAWIMANKRASEQEGRALKAENDLKVIEHLIKSADCTIDNIDGSYTFYNDRADQLQMDLNEISTKRTQEQEQHKKNVRYWTDRSEEWRLKCSQLNLAIDDANCKVEKEGAVLVLKIPDDPSPKLIKYIKDNRYKYGLRDANDVIPLLKAATVWHDSQKCSIPKCHGWERRNLMDEIANLTDEWKELVDDAEFSFPDPT